MKGRRQARRVALQALYELDLTRHLPDQVLAARVENLRAMAVAAYARTAAERAAFESCRQANPAAVGGVQEGERLANDYGIAPDRARLLAQLVVRLAEQIAYVEALVHGVVRHRAAIDAVIARIAPEWPVDQMAPVDRNVLRIALWELATGSAPERVAISEAVELARAFSGEGARRMVNGALGAYVAGTERLRLVDSADPLPASEEP